MEHMEDLRRLPALNWCGSIAKPSCTNAARTDLERCGVSHGQVAMLLHQLREDVLAANLERVSQGLVVYTFGNVSGVDRAQGLVVIKPSGVE